jgi:hypothetical protein
MPSSDTTQNPRAPGSARSRSRVREQLSVLGAVSGETAMVAPAPALGQGLGEPGRRAPQAGPRVPMAASRSALAALRPVERAARMEAPQAGPRVTTAALRPVERTARREAPQAGPRVTTAGSRLLVGQAIAGIQEARAPVWRAGVARPAVHLLRAGVAVHPRVRIPRCNSTCVPGEPHRSAAYRPSVKATNSHRPAVAPRLSRAAPCPN